MPRAVQRVAHPSLRCQALAWPRNRLLCRQRPHMPQSLPQDLTLHARLASRALQNAVFGDVDGDGQLEVVVATFRHADTQGGPSGMQRARQGSCCSSLWLHALGARCGHAAAELPSSFHPDDASTCNPLLAAAARCTCCAQPRGSPWSPSPSACSARCVPPSSGAPSTPPLSGAGRPAQPFALRAPQAGAHSCRPSQPPRTFLVARHQPVVAAFESWTFRPFWWCCCCCRFSTSPCVALRPSSRPPLCPFPRHVAGHGSPTVDQAGRPQDPGPADRGDRL